LNSSNHPVEKFTYLPKSNAESFIVLLPIINGFATILTPHFGDSLFNPGVIRAIIIALFFVPFLIEKFPYKYPVAQLTLLFICYLFILTLISSKFFTSFNVFLKVMVSSSGLLFGIYYGKDELFLKRISISISVMLIMFLVDFFLANLFGYGGRSYLGVENELNFGASGVNLAKQVSAILLMMPVIYSQFDSKFIKRILISISILAVLFVLFAFKRSALTALVLGYLYILYAIPNKIKSFKWVLIFLMFGLLLTPIYLDQVLDNFQARKEAIYLDKEENLEKQARYNEYLKITNAWVNGTISHKLVGSELFNDTYLYRVRRMLHTDYMSLLSGSGIIGLILYILIYLSIIFSLRRKSKYFNFLITYYYEAIGIALVIGMIFFGISGLVQAIEPRGTILLFIGALISAPIKSNKNINAIDR
jgi:hypothetical protein